MAKNTCKLCYRRFASPRALAGHMRSHSVASSRPQISPASSAARDAAAAEEGGGQGYVLREKPKRKVRLAEFESSDRESEAEYSSPDAKRAHAGSGDAEPVSSVSDAGTPEEDVALSLVLLSRDSWPAAAAAAWPSSRADDADSGDVNVDVAELPPVAEAARKRTGFQCPACKKVFRSYQALGGHRASHVRGGRGGCLAPPPNPPASPRAQPPQPFLDGDGGQEGSKPHPHECPYCFRVFPSGQALGGHKRSQLCSPAAAAAAESEDDPPATFKSLSLIDLNLPASLDDAELSAVSDPFLSSKRAS